MFVDTITYEPLHLAWWNLAQTCSLTTSRTLLNFMVIGQRSRSRGFFLFFFCVRDTAATRRQYFASAGLDDLVNCQIMMNSRYGSTWWCQWTVCLLFMCAWCLQFLQQVQEVHRRIFHSVGWKTREGQSSAVWCLQVKYVRNNSNSHVCYQGQGLVIDCSQSPAHKSGTVCLLCSSGRTFPKNYY